MIFQNLWAALKRWLRFLLRPFLGKPFDCDRHGVYGQCEFCVTELETWHHNWRLEYDREYYMIYGPKISLTKRRTDFMGYRYSVFEDEEYTDNFREWLAYQSRPGL